MDFSVAVRRRSILVVSALMCSTIFCCSSSGGKMAAPAAASVQMPVAQKDARGSYRFLMQQEGKNMSADQFDAWMRANGMRVARGKPTAPARKARRP